MALLLRVLAGFSFAIADAVGGVLVAHPPPREHRR
jgi:hypothetical protein